MGQLKAESEQQLPAHLVELLLESLREIAAAALKETYFQDGGRRAGSLEEVHSALGQQSPINYEQRSTTLATAA
ncbi:hypothetical protein [Streptomyces sp. NPDC005096]|uniref:hypothetical protein n=1 Tax=Streptomyces sp. NPDC005096 TaxID=3154559 RepID=UPI0033B5B130